MTFELMSVQSLEREVKELTVTLQTLQSEKQQLTEDDQEMIRQRAKLEFDVKDLEESLVDDKKSKVCSCVLLSLIMRVCVDSTETVVVCRRSARES